MWTDDEGYGCVYGAPDTESGAIVSRIYTRWVMSRYGIGWSIN